MADLNASLGEIKKTVESYPRDKRHSLAILQDLQRCFGYVPRESLDVVSDYLGIKVSALYSILTFYKALSLKPKGKHVIKVCDGTACHIRGSSVLLDALERALGVKAGETTADGFFTVETVNCVGACAIAPVMVVDKNYHPKVKPDQIETILKTYREGNNQAVQELQFQNNLQIKNESSQPVSRRFEGGKTQDLRDNQQGCRIDPMKKIPAQAERTLLVCCGTGCIANGALAVIDALENAAKSTEKGSSKIEVNYTGGIKHTGCNGFCENGPIVRLMPDDISYYNVKPADAPDIINHAAGKGEIVERLLYKDDSGKKALSQNENPFYARQYKNTLENSGLIEPGNIKDYINNGGFNALKKALSMSAEMIICEVEKSGLRGRGGAGFPTGKKWRQCAGYEDFPRYVICNGDEGDPCAFMDRSILEGDPHLVIEGLTIAARAVNAAEGFMYIRDEYDLALKNVKKALETARAQGYLGKNILGSGWDFDISVVRGGGAFVCGESSALMASIEGRAGEPRTKYIRSVQKGLWDKPTVLNNVETLANIPCIISYGSEQFKNIGTENSPGTKVFALVGKVKCTGLIEVPMGTTLRKLVFDIGGGILNKRGFKAVQTGGPSGGCIPSSLLDLPIDFDTLDQYGSMMGSGGVVVMDDRTCMVEVARYYTRFLAEESCGKCAPCRGGLRRMLEILTDITSGKGIEGDIERLKGMALTMQAASLCGLGKTAANPVLSTIKYFRDEYEAHLKNKVCPAGVCPVLTTFRIVKDKCKSCGLCVKSCPVSAVRGEKGKPYIINQKLCISCTSCFNACPFSAIVTRGRV